MYDAGNPKLFALWQPGQMGWVERWEGDLVQVWCMRQGAQGWCTGMTLKGWDGEGGGREVQDGERMYTRGWFMSLYGKNHYNTVKESASN